MKETLRTLFQQKFNPIEYRKVVLQNLLHAQQLLSQPQFLEETNDGDRIYGLGYLTDADGKQIGLYYTDVVNSDVRRKRVGFRQMMKSYVKYGVDAAIAVFADNEHWRLSYMSDLKGGETSAKRFSYILGDLNGQYNTPVNRLAQLGTQAPRLRLKDIFEAFSVETLSDEFFDLYRDHYADIVEYLTGKRMVKVDSKWVEKVIHAPLQSVYEQLTGVADADKIVRDYVKKMMGRIVFLHFLQKKGWLNGDVNFMRHTFGGNESCQDDFLEKILEPLFFGFLNTRKEDRAKLFDNHPNWDKNLLTIWENIPYLNGGLFEQDEVDNLNIRLPRSMFDDLFKFLAEYNFTVDENDPDDAEVGVDPEMLGKIFESLLEDNKAKGAFYTPKEIVRYMCKESLIAYLDSKLESAGTTEAALERHNARSANNPTQGTQCGNRENIAASTNASERLNARSANTPTQESVPLSQCGDVDPKEECVSETRDLKTAIRAFVEHHEMQPELEPYRDILDAALRNVKICDPAIGSGAFPMGLLNELWRCREALAIREANNLQDSQDFVSAASRSKLKKEIIENNIYGVDIENGAIDIARLRFWLSIVVDAEEPEPLPNFDYKFMQGNSLIESYKGIDLSRISNRLRGGQSKSTQLLLGLDSDFSKKNLQRLMRDYFSVTDHKQKASMRQAINDEVKRLITDFIGGTAADLDKLDPSANQDFFLWHTWFKDIFDNGGFDIVIGNPPYIQLQADGGRLADLYSRMGYDSFDRRGDIYELFYEKGNIILNKGGILCYITSNGWMKSQYGDNLRYYLHEYTNPVLLVDFNQMRLFENAIVETNILMFAKTKNVHSCKSCSFLNHDRDTILANLSNAVDIESCSCNFSLKSAWTIGVQSEQQVKEKIESNGIIIERWPLTIYRGITSGCNVGFIIDGYTKESIYIDATEDEKRLLDNTIFPILQGRNLKKYSYSYNDKYMIVTPRGYNIDRTPTLKKYMLTNYEALSNKSGNNEWYELQASPSGTMLRNMHKEKIMWGEISDKAKFTYDDGRYFAEATTFFMTTDDKGVSLKYLLAILNSSLSEWYFHKIATTTGMGTNRWKKYKLEQLPVARPTKEQEQQIVTIVDQILQKKEANVNADTSVLEHEIDMFVYQLYNLTPEEIAIIEQQ